MTKENEKADFKNLPACAAEFIKLVIKKMRYRRKVRQDVQAELAAHFEDELKNFTTDQEKEQKAKKLITEFGDTKLLAVLLRRAKKRCRPVWKKVLVRGLQVLGVVFLYLLVCLGPLAIGKTNISVDYIGWLNKLVQAGRDEANNARPYYEKAAELYVEMPDWMVSSSSKWPTDFNDMELKSLSSWLESNKDVFEMLRTATKFPYYWSHYQKNGDVDYLSEGLMPKLMESLTGYRHIALAMREQIRYEAYSGDIDIALRDCVVIMKFGDHLHGHGLLVEQLVGVAIEAVAFNEISRILRKTDVPAESLKEIQEKLAKQFEKRKPIISLEAEKVFWYDQIQRSFTDDGKGDGRLLIRGLPYVVKDWKDSLWGLFTFSYPSRREIVTKIDEYFEQVDQLFEETPWQLHNKDADEDKWNHILNQASLMLRIQGPAHKRVSQISWRLKTHRVALLALLAIIRYQKNAGQYPEDLNELVSTGYLNSLPMDTFSGRPLVYRMAEEGFILYSIGQDLKDDGGILGLGSDGKPRMWADEGDWVFWPMLKSEVN